MSAGMRASLVALLAFFNAGRSTATLPKHYSVWPPPRSMTVSGPPKPIHSQFRINVALPGKNWILDEISHRYGAIFGDLISFAQGLAVDLNQTALRTLHIAVEDIDEQRLTTDTDESYELIVGEHTDLAKLFARTVFGALRGLETFRQLLNTQGQPSLLASSIDIKDAPQFPWRGVMIDSGRRFFPVDFVKNLIDTMQAVKMSVLHMHMSDHCRFAVESKLYPQLTASLSGDYSGYYTQADIKELIAYAKVRGVRIVPEFDLPAHARGFLPLDIATHKDLGNNGVQFCQNASSERPSQYMHRDQLHNDPANNYTLSTLRSLLHEMANLFEDPVMHLGGDETYSAGPCTKETNRDLQMSLCSVLHETNKTPAGWEEFLFDANAASSDSIIQIWGNDRKPAQVAAMGHKVVNSQSHHWYDGIQSLSRGYMDPAQGLAGPNRSMILGGEIVSFTDFYCPTLQCHAFEGPKQIGRAMFPAAQDDAFSNSQGGLLWPFGYVAAAAFWNFDPTVDPKTPEWESAIYALNDRLRSEGSLACPSHCKCDLLKACGKPYVGGEVKEAILV